MILVLFLVLTVIIIIRIIFLCILISDAHCDSSFDSTVLFSFAVSRMM